MNLILSGYLPDTDDGKVTIESAKIEGMHDFIALPVTHPMVMKIGAVITQTLLFLQYGAFNRHSGTFSSRQRKPGLNS